MKTEMRYKVGDIVMVFPKKEDFSVHVPNGTVGKIVHLCDEKEKMRYIVSFPKETKATDGQKVVYCVECRHKYGGEYHQYVLEKQTVKIEGNWR